MRSRKQMRLPRITIWIVFLLSILLALHMFGKTVQAASNDDRPEVVIKFYYMGPCETCDEEGKFTELLYAQTAGLRDDVSISLLAFNAFKSDGKAKFQEQCDLAGVSSADLALPTVWINDSWISGQENIDVQLKSVFQSEVEKLLANQAADPATDSVLLYFHITPCDECAQAESYLETLEATYSIQTVPEQSPVLSKVTVEHFNINQAENLALVEQLFNTYNVPSDEQKVPIIFLQDSYLSGASAIENQLVERIEKGLAVGTRLPSQTTDPQVREYDWPAIFLTGLINGLNPCSLSMLLFLIALLLSQNRNVLSLGLSFIAGKTIAYLAISTVLYTVFLSLNQAVFQTVSLVLKVVLLVVILVVVIMNLSDFFAAKNEKYNKIINQLPAGLRRFNHERISQSMQAKSKWGLIAAAIILGFVISAGEFLCTGQILLSTIIYLVRSGNQGSIVAWGKLGVYVLAMQIPLLILTFAAWKGKEIFHLSEFIRKYLPVIKLVNACLFILFFVLVAVYF